MYNRNNLKRQAEFYRQRYFDGDISIEVAKEMIMPYINLLNIDNEKISKAYGRYLPPITFNKFIKST
jgi:hypothetical protein